jgi:hypothetical protein
MENYDVRKILFAYAHFIRYYINSTDTVLPDYFNPEMFPCNSSLTNVPEFNDNYNILQHTCMNLRNYNYSFGGNLDGRFVYYFYILLTFCRDFRDFSISEVNCSSLEKVKDLLKNHMTFEIIYPQYYLIPDDIENPMRVSYNSTF